MVENDTVTVGSISLFGVEWKAEKTIEGFVSDGWKLIGKHSADCLDGYEITLQFRRETNDRK